jgi:GTP pyrophosphokinase
MSLPRGATAVDFAYAVHTDIGNRCVAVKINQELMPLRTELKNGDRVEIITAAHAKPNPLWLNFVTTGKARSRIRHFLKTMHFEESAKLGERLLNQALTGIGAVPADIKDAHWEKFARDAGAKSRQEVLADVGLGKRLAAVVARRLLSRSEPGPHEAPALAGSVIIHGSEGMAVQFANCCRPIPGDPIIGLISKGQGMVIHTHDCPVIAKARHDPERVLDVSWDPDTRKLFDVSIKLVVANQRGVLAKVAAEIAEAESNIQNVAVDPEDGSSYTNMFFTLQVLNRLHLARIVRALRRIPEVVRLSRVKG